VERGQRPRPAAESNLEYTAVLLRQSTPATNPPILAFFFGASVTATSWLKLLPPQAPSRCDRGRETWEMALERPLLFLHKQPGKQCGTGPFGNLIKKRRAFYFCAIVDFTLGMD